MLPTGGGKSLCYQLPALVRGGLCVVVSPLIALMHDQCANLRQRGVVAEAWLGDNGEAVLNAVRGHDSAFLYMAPERLEDRLFLARCHGLNVQTVVVDEAHCISQWGHNFRPQFKRIHTLQTHFPHAVWGCFTATATAEVLADIAAQMPGPAAIHASPMRRPNLAYAVCHSGDRDAALLRHVRQQHGQGLVYVRTRHEATLWGQRMREAGLKAAGYHAGLAQPVKETLQAQWMQGSLQVLACTSAFGMGIDAPNVRWVAHASPPPDLESYVQEAGRAGRDGAKSECVLFASPHDLDWLAERLDARYPDMADVRRAYNAIANAAGAPVGSLPTNPTPVDGKPHRAAIDLLIASGHFREEAAPPSIPSTGNVLWLGPRRELPEPHRNELAAWCEQRARDATRRVCLEVLRRELPCHAPWSHDLEHLHEDLRHLDDCGMIDWQRDPPPTVLRWLRPRVPLRELHVDRSRKRMLRNKLESVRTYLELGPNECRATFLESQFAPPSSRPAGSPPLSASDHATRPCGACDLCLQRTNQSALRLENALHRGPFDVPSWLEELPPGEREHGLRLLQNRYRSGQLLATAHHAQGVGRSDVCLPNN